MARNRNKFVPLEQSFSEYLEPKRSIWFVLFETCASYVNLDRARNSRFNQLSKKVVVLKHHLSLQPW